MSAEIAAPPTGSPVDGVTAGRRPPWTRATM